MNLLIGVLLTIVAGVLAGNCMLPIKFLRRWQWENAWLVFTIISLLLLPWLLAVTLVSNLGEVYASLSWRELSVPFLLGLGWGVAQTLFGLSVARLGMALGYAIVVGLGAVLGTLVPLFLQHAGALAPGNLSLLIAGVIVMVAGIAISALAGKRREAGERKPEAKRTSAYGSALALAVGCGILAPMLNFSFAFGKEIGDAAVRLGNSTAISAYAVWPVGLMGGLFPNLIYSIYLLNRNQTWNRFLPFGAESRLAVWMALLWMGSIACYGVAASFLGTLGTSVGWALFQIFMIMTANASGMVTGEWRGAALPARRLFWLGLTLLALATVLISTANAAAGQ